MSRRRWFCWWNCDSICNRSVSRARAASSSHWSTSIKRSSVRISLLSVGVTDAVTGGVTADVTRVSGVTGSGVTSCNGVTVDVTSLVCNSSPARSNSAVSSKPSGVRLSLPLLM